MTLIEVMIAMVVLVVGVLGTVTLVQTGMLSTSRTSARDQGTNLARDFVERSRQVPYTSVTTADVLATLRSTILSESPTPIASSSFLVTRRGVAYTVKATACSIDDPTDGVGVGDATYCVAGTGAPGPGPPPPVGGGPAHSVLGVDVGSIYVAAGGSLLTTVCNALGNDSVLLSKLTSVVSKVVPLSLCPSRAPSLTSVQLDSHADDMRRVRVDISWSRNGAGSVSQTTLLTNPLQN